MCPQLQLSIPACLYLKLASPFFLLPQLDALTLLRKEETGEKKTFRDLVKGKVIANNLSERIKAAARAEQENQENQEDAVQVAPAPGIGRH